MAEFGLNQRLRQHDDVASLQEAYAQKYHDIFNT